MTYRRFEDLPVWNAAIRLAVRVYETAEMGRLGHCAGLRNQIERAVLSISNNIAEGFERGTMAELISFLYIARGSAGEVRSMITLLQHLDRDGVHGFDDLKLEAIDISRQLGAWITSLENSSIKGVRSLTDQERSGRAAARRRDEFLGHLREVRDGRSSDERSPET